MLPRDPQLLTPASASPYPHAPACLHLRLILSSLHITGLLPATCALAPAGCTVHLDTYLPSCCTVHAHIGFCSMAVVRCVLQGSNR